MKKQIALLLALTTLFCVSCGKKEEPKKVEPDLSQMKTICELATMECYYHGVTKYLEEDATKFLWITKDKYFWIEYDSVVTLGIDASLLNISIDGQSVTVTLPPTMVSYPQTELIEGSTIVDKDSAKTEIKDGQKALEQAEKEILDLVTADTTLLESAQNRAKELLEDYINNIGTSTGIEYSITWEYVDESGNVIKTEEP